VVTEREKALLTWLHEMDDQHVSTGLLARAFEAGWAARGAAGGQPDQAEPAARSRSSSL
jgi:hypothetical protein